MAASTCVAISIRNALLPSTGANLSAEVSPGRHALIVQSRTRVTRRTSNISCSSKVTSSSNRFLAHLGLHSKTRTPSQYLDRQAQLRRSSICAAEVGDGGQLTSTIISDMKEKVRALQLCSQHSDLKHQMHLSRKLFSFSFALTSVDGEKFLKGAPFCGLYIVIYMSLLLTLIA
jgi:hypothetical protein